MVSVREEGLERDMKSGIWWYYEMNTTKAILLGLILSQTYVAKYRTYVAELLFSGLPRKVVGVNPYSSRKTRVK